MKKRTIIVGLKSDNCSREMLLRLLSSVVGPGDNVLAVHVQELEDTFDPNTFHIHEDLCKSKQVDFLVKVCTGDSFITELTHQVRINFGTILTLGCNTPWPNDSVVANCLKGLPPTCTLLVMDNGGRTLVRKTGTSQQGSPSELRHSSSLPSPNSTFYSDHQKTRHQLSKSLTMPSASTSPSSTICRHADNNKELHRVSRTIQHSDFTTLKLLQMLAILEANGSIRRFTSQELNRATDNFNPEMLIGEGGHSQVYRGKTLDVQDLAVKVLRSSSRSAEDLFREIDMLSGLKHEHIVRVVGYCYTKDMHAVVYNLSSGSLKEKLRELGWEQRMRVAVGVAKALEYLHHFLSPPIIHRDVKSSNILLFEDSQPRLSDFGTATYHQHQQQHQHSLEDTKSFPVVGTFGYLAPEYMMYGKVDEKIDVYSYGVVLLELITGKDAIQTKPKSSRESLVLWARSLLTSGLCERLIDPNLKEEYNKEETKAMLTAARLCLMHSSSRRPTMRTILRLLKEPEYSQKTHKERDDELLNDATFEGETGMWRYDDSAATDNLFIEDI